jgi:hypothetical protein
MPFIDKISGDLYDPLSNEWRDEQLRQQRCLP